MKHVLGSIKHDGHALRCIRRRWPHRRRGYRDHAAYPHPGWVEHDAEILELRCCGARCDRDEWGEPDVIGSHRVRPYRLAP